MNEIKESKIVNIMTKSIDMALQSWNRSKLSDVSKINAKVIRTAIIAVKIFEELSSNKE